MKFFLLVLVVVIVAVVVARMARSRSQTAAAQATPSPRPQQAPEARPGPIEQPASVASSGPLDDPEPAPAPAPAPHNGETGEPAPETRGSVPETGEAGETGERPLTEETDERLETTHQPSWTTSMWDPDRTESEERGDPRHPHFDEPHEMVEETPTERRDEFEEGAFDADHEDAPESEEPSEEARAEQRAQADAREDEPHRQAEAADEREESDEREAEDIGAEAPSEHVADEQQVADVDGADPEGAVAEEAEEIRDGGYGVGSAAPLPSGGTPQGHPVKAWNDTRTFMTPEHPGYESARPHVWFTDPEVAEHAGFSPAPS